MDTFVIAFHLAAGDRLVTDRMNTSRIGVITKEDSLCPIVKWNDGKTQQLFWDYLDDYVIPEPVDDKARRQEFKDAKRKLINSYWTEDTKPRKNDTVWRHNSEGDKVYGKINWVDRKNDAVMVYWFLEKRHESCDYSSFNDYSSRGGKTSWKIDDD